jgi:hypothetical protein
MMEARKLLIRSGLLLSMLGAAGLVSLPVAAQTYPDKAPAATTTPKTDAGVTAKTDDAAAEFDKLDKNKDGAIDKSEAALEPRLLANFDAADTNKDGKVDKAEWAAFQKNKALMIKK